MYNDVIVLGVVVSILFSELTQLSPAGLVVPGYMVLCLKTPERIAYTLLIVLLTWGASKLLGKFVILYGRRSFAAMILLSFAINLLLQNTPLLPFNPGIIGCLVPGIMAKEFEKQGVWRSLASLGIVVGILALLLLLFDRPVLGF